IASQARDYNIFPASAGFLTNIVRNFLIITMSYCPFDTSSIQKATPGGAKKPRKLGGNILDRVANVEK
ncbi:MAG: hypothetical protein II445_00790, partial [Muribaculaceae bacterium]|nr:hypothetical protein [Muribaculaceae bacterium]